MAITVKTYDTERDSQVWVVEVTRDELTNLDLSLREKEILAETCLPTTGSIYLLKGLILFLQKLESKRYFDTMLEFKKLKESRDNKYFSNLSEKEKNT